VRLGLRLPNLLDCADTRLPSPLRRLATTVHSLSLREAHWAAALATDFLAYFPGRPSSLSCRLLGAGHVALR
jgi:hypothetical protein